jgi:allophanate hydrolase subunit 2
LIRVFASEKSLKTKRILPTELVPCYDGEFSVDVVPGPQEDMFTAEGVETFLSSQYTVTPDSDRMGYRLSGTPIERKSTAELVTEALVKGSAQVPSNGQPIILMADAQTSGGYPKIATVCTPGASRLAQAKPNDKVHFNKISLSEAHKQYIEYEKRLHKLENELVREAI